jgi:hypothetical protein
VVAGSRWKCACWAQGLPPPPPNTHPSHTSSPVQRLFVKGVAETAHAAAHALQFLAVRVPAGQQVGGVPPAAKVQDNTSSEKSSEGTNCPGACGHAASRIAPTHPPTHPPDFSAISVPGADDDQIQGVVQALAVVPAVPGSSTRQYNTVLSSISAVLSGLAAPVLLWLRQAAGHTSQSSTQHTASARFLSLSQWSERRLGS